MFPAQVPDYAQIRGDAWYLQILLDVGKDWSGSTFTLDDTLTGGFSITMDTTHQADLVPFLLLSMDAVTTHRYIARSLVHWNLSESPLIGRTFLSGNVTLYDR